MADYDSDSSIEGSDYTETNVLLGYASKEPGEDTISRLGGKPTWLDPSISPSASLARCKVCKDLMVLLLQLNGDLPENFPGHDRRLYVLSCRRKTCRRKEGSIRVLRGVRISEAAAAREKTGKEDTPRQLQQQSPQGQGRAVNNTSLGEALFGAKPITTSGAANPFSTSSASNPAQNHNPFASTSNNPFSAPHYPPLSELAAKPAQKPAESPSSDLPKTFANALSLNDEPNSPAFGPVTPPEPWPAEPDLPPPYPISYLSEADYEVLDKIEEPVPVPTETMDIDDEGGAGTRSSKTPQNEDNDVFESTIDTTFQKFADRLSQNPEQVIRYEFKGQPLLYSKSDAVGKLLSPPGGAGHGNAKVTTSSGGVGAGKIPRCANCGAGRVFEVQLTPHAITELESEEVSLEGIDWGTVIVAVCERDCAPRATAVGEVGYVEEWAGVQWEELSEKKR